MMCTSIEDLPFELFSSILETTAELNAKAGVNFTYGLSQAPLPIHNKPLERTVRGHRPLDALRWDSVESVRQVNSRWHAWALSYALRDLYIRRWRGSERWIESRSLPFQKGRASSVAVYREPYIALKKTAELFNQSQDAGAFVRRLWFDGFHTVDMSRLMLQTLGNCNLLQSVTLPWTTLRHFNAPAWRQLLSETQLTCLELTAIALKESPTLDEENQIDHQAMQDTTVDFGNVRRLRIVGSTNFKPITDDDLRLISRTARNLKALHINGISSVSIKGVVSLVEASRDHLEILEYSPLCASGFEHPDPDVDEARRHWCSRITSCPRLTDLTIALPNLCSELFRDHSVNWSGDVHIRTSELCGFNQSIASPDCWTALSSLLDASRAMAGARRESRVHVNIEIFIRNWLFEPSKHQVHGNIELAEELAGYVWPMSKVRSFKGPYGQTGLYGKEAGPYSSISEGDFFEGLRQYHLSL